MSVIGWLTGLDQARKEIARLVTERNRLYADRQEALRDLDVLNERVQTLAATVASFEKDYTEIELREKIARQRREIKRLYRELERRR